MFGLFNTTPQYAGDGQPAADSNGGALGFLTGLFAVPTPKYATAEARPAADAGAIFVPAPTMCPATSEQVMQSAYQDAAVMSDAASDPLAAQPACSVPLPFAIVIQRSQK